MKPIITLVSATIGLLACAAVAKAQSGQPASNQPILDSPPTPSVGDTFTYRVGLVRTPEVWTYLGLNGDRLCFSKSQAGTETTTVCRTRTDNFRTNSAATSFGEVPMEGGASRPRLSFPLFVGKTWDYSWQGNLQQPGGGRQGHQLFNYFTTKVKVTAYEPVTVGAGTFDAFKIEAESIQWGEKGIAFLATLYYSPNLGTIKRHAWSAGPESYSYDTNMELVSYTHTQAGEAR